MGPPEGAAVVAPADETGTAALKRLHLLCDSLRSGLNESLELKRSAPNGAQSRILLSDSSLSLLELREVNRTVQDAIATLKGRSASANQEVDAADLKLQNLQYEKNYFLREIRHARDYPPDKPIEMLPKADFLRNDAATGLAAEADDAHAFHLARLQLELEQRMQLCERRDTLLAKRKELEESIASRRAFLEGMGSQLASITRISMPLQDLLQHRLSARWQESRQIRLMPPPLRLLFERALAHRDTTLKTLRVSVEGDMEHAATLAAQAANSANGTSGANGGVGGGGAAAHPKPTPKKVPAKRLKTTGDGEAGDADAAADAAAADDDDETTGVHPLHVHVVLPLPPPPAEADGELPAAEGVERHLVLDFSCMASQPILAVAISTNEPAAPPAGLAPPNPVGGASNSSTHGSRPAAAEPAVTRLTADLFIDLLGADAGDALPPPTPAATAAAVAAAAPPLLSAAQQREAILSLLPAVPYRWAQMLGRGGELVDIHRFGEVLERLIERVRAADAVALQLSRLARLDATLPAHLASPLPGPPMPPASGLTAWRRVDYENDLSADARARLPAVPSWRARSQRLYHAEISRGQVVLGVTISLFADFPRSAAHLSLDWTTPPSRFAAGPPGAPTALEALASPAAVRVAKVHRAALRDLALLQMERELNHPAEPPSELSQHEGVYSLSVAIQRAIMLLDAYIETDGDGGGACAIRGTLCSRRVRGRDRRRPFVFDPFSGQYDQAAQRAAGGDA